MKIKTISFVLLSLPALAFMDILSNGAPAESTGAPAEANCTKSGCHYDSPANSGPGISFLSVSGSPASYVPNTTYTINTGISQANISRFGFQLLALADRDSSNAGTLAITDGGRTQIIPGFSNLANRSYMTYTYAGTAATGNGTDQWSFNWTAPASDIGPVSFYLATIAANGDGTDMGDYCYLKKLSLPCSPAGIIEKNSKTEILVFPNPASEQVQITYTLKQEGHVSLELIDLSGKTLLNWNYGQQAAGRYTRTFEPGSSIPAGAYFVRLQTAEGVFSKQLFILH
jgi:hypothetical protein